MLFSQLSQKQIANDIRRRYLEPLLEQADLDANNVSVEKLSDLGFSNNVFRIVCRGDTPSSTAEKPRILVAKVFSDLSKKRIHPNQKFMGEIDELLHRHGIGPTVVAHTSDALLMEYIDGQVLTESMVLDATNDRGLSICRQVGDKLGRMHSLEGKGGPNMLWHALDVLLASVDPDFEMQSSSGGTWNLSKLQDTIGTFRHRLELLDVPCVPMGHGDFKLSNVMLTSDTGKIQFIDFELTGTHYRGYDLAKFFRTSAESVPSPLRSRHQKAFWESYHNQLVTSFGDDGGTYNSVGEALSQLEREAELFEPMTWLEAASFFLSMANLDDLSQKEKWNRLARNRLTNFEKTKVNLKH